jgi:fructose-specific phosphotransferase system IIA component
MANQLSISDVILPNTIDLDVTGVQNKDEIFQHMVKMLYRADVIGSEREFLKAIYEREALGPTYMGDLIAIPHGKSDTVKRTGIAFCRCNESFYYTTKDGDGGDTSLVFMLAIPDQMSADDYIRILAKLARLLVYPDFISDLNRVKSYSHLIDAIKDCERLLE